MRDMCRNKEGSDYDDFSTIVKVTRNMAPNIFIRIFALQPDFPDPSSRVPAMYNLRVRDA